MHFSSHSNRDRCELCVHQECPCNRTLWDSLRQHPSQFLSHSSCSFYHLNVAACANCTLWGELHCHMLILYIQYILQSTGGRRAAQQVINKVGSSFRMAVTGSHIKGFFFVLVPQISAVSKGTRGGEYLENKSDEHSPHCTGRCTTVQTESDQRSH